MSSRNPNADRISDLPGNVIDHILSRLPLRDAARTSLLSTEWRYKWTFIPDLVFNFRFDRTILPKCRVENIIYQVLLRHQGTINKFALQVPSYITSPDVDQWIYFLSNHQVHHFTLHLHRGSKLRMPSRFYAFQHLRHLFLCRCVFELPHGFKGFSQLVSLDCHHVDFAPEFLGKFVSQCPQLENVRVVSCSDLEAIEVEGPKLIFFTFDGVFKSIRFKNCPVLADVSLSAAKVDLDAISQSSYPKKHIDLVPTLQELHLHLHPRLLEILGAGGASNQFPSCLNRLRSLHLSLYLNSVAEVSFARCLVRSSPNLETLWINFSPTRIVEAVVEYIRVQKTPDCSMNQLKKVVILVFHCTESLLEFAAYLLAAAGALEEMMILFSPCRPVSPDGGLGLMNQLRELPCASPNAQIDVRC